MSNITIENIDIIFSYLKPKEKLFINSKYRTQAINQSKEKIRKITYKWLLDYNEQIDNNYYYVPKIIYKRFYPLKYRISFIEKVLDMFAGSIKYNFVCDILNEYSSLVEQFNHIIDILSDDELFCIGW